jgi:hypothetical protein
MEGGIAAARVLKPFPTGTKLLQGFFAGHEILLLETSGLPMTNVSTNRGSTEVQMRLPWVPGYIFPGFAIAIPIHLYRRAGFFERDRNPQIGRRRFLEHFRFYYRLPCPILSAFFCGKGGMPIDSRST